MHILYPSPSTLGPTSIHVYIIYTAVAVYLALSPCGASGLRDNVICNLYIDLVPQTGGREPKTEHNGRLRRYRRGGRDRRLLHCISLN